MKLLDLLVIEATMITFMTININETSGNTSDLINTVQMIQREFDPKWSVVCPPSSPPDFPQPLRCPSGFALGTSLGSQEISQASNEFPKISRVLVECEQLGIHQSINQFTINPSLGSALGNPSMYMMIEHIINHLKMLRMGKLTKSATLHTEDRQWQW